MASSHVNRHGRKAQTHASAAARQAQPETTMLPPENTIEVKPEGSSGESVNQRRLREFYELDAMYHDIAARRAAAYAKLQDLIIRGAAINQGQYKVNYGVRLVRRPKYKQVVIDLKGEQFQQRVLEQTQPHAHFRVRVD